MPAAALLTAWLAAAGATGDDPLEAHLEAAERSLRAESTGTASVVWEGCTQAIAALPEGPRAPRCRERLAFLDLRRDADGSWRSWDALEATRRAYRHLDPETARRRVVDLLAAEGVGPMVAAEATLWLALDSLDRRRDATEALRLTDAAWPDRHALDAHVRQRLVLTRAQALATLGRHAEALEVEAEVRVADGGTRRGPAEEVARRQLEARLTTASWVTLGAFLVVTTPLAIRRRRAWPMPAGLVPLVGGTGAAWLLAEGWSEGAGAALPRMGLGFVAIHLLTLAGRTAPAAAAWRALVSLGSALATVAVAWLALESTQGIGWVWR
ncbi:MAG: hypothetical protein H6732_16650 [Alphaproteobacteria bacterium]|nr:hypothetical protein [Alphaproteobacteria bacterium]